LAKFQIPYFSQISNLLVTDTKQMTVYVYKSNLRSVIFILNSTLLFIEFSRHQKQLDTCTVSQ